MHLYDDTSKLFTKILFDKLFQPLWQQGQILSVLTLDSLHQFLAYDGEDSQQSAMFKLQAM